MHSPQHDEMEANMNSPRVTVCVPVRNGSRTIRRTLDSILAQDYPNLEVIVSDNCSTDDTARIVQEYAGRGVKYYLNPKLEAWGESNWNHVLSLAQGPLIALYHADDLYTPTMVRRQVEFLQAHPHVSAVFTMMQMIDEQDRPVRWGSTRLPKELGGRECFEFPEFFNAVLKYGTFIPVPTMMTRRQVIDTVGVFRWKRCASASDIDLYLRMAKEWGPIGIIDEPLHRYRLSSQQGTAQLAKNRTELAHFFQVLDAHLNDPEERRFAQPQSIALYKTQRANDQVLSAINLLVQGKATQARVRLRESLRSQDFVTVRQRPRLLFNLAVGLFLLVSVYLGLGTWAGKQAHRAYLWKMQRRREPVA
jgi:glycosyltransferase involved in cell wall biosynthesis